jgi:hypothetical protein
MLARISDLVGAAFFFAIVNLLLVYAYAGFHRPFFQLGAENNIEKSRCLAQTRKIVTSAARASLVLQAYASCVSEHRRIHGGIRAGRSRPA